MPRSPARCPLGPISPNVLPATTCLPHSSNVSCSPGSKAPCTVGQCQSGRQKVTICYELAPPNSKPPLYVKNSYLQTPKPGPFTIFDLSWENNGKKDNRALVAAIPANRLQDFINGEAARGLCKVNASSKKAATDTIPFNETCAVLGRRMPSAVLGHRMPRFRRTAKQ